MKYEGGMTADYADYGDLRRMGFGFGLQFSWKINL